MKLPDSPLPRVALGGSCVSRTAQASVLHRLLDENSGGRSMKYGPTLVFHNHLGAMLTSSYHLGAPDDELTKIASGVDEKSKAAVGEFRLGLRSIADDESVAPRDLRIDSSNWKSHLGGCGLYGYGSHFNYPAYLKFFRDERLRLGEEETLRTYFPELASGIGGDFFHAVIELGYYFEAGCAPATTMDSGLAWLASAYVEWPERASSSEAFDSPTAAMAAMTSSPASQPFAFDLDDGSSGYINAMETLIDDHLNTVYQYDVDIPEDYDGQKACLKDICLAAADSFAEGGCKDFYTLHSVTGSRAVWAILSSLEWPPEVQRKCLQALWRTVLFTHLVRIPPSSQRSPPPRDTSWQYLAKEARKSANSHIIKVVYTCADFYDRWRDERHLKVAAGTIAHREAGGGLVGTGAGSKIEMYVKEAAASH